ncbi:MAG TPA: hypothetical protein VFY71_10455 [Planctomycetota bacterium]|nr:hypothetical protein [Planctomycetota bacterium]
MPRAAVALLVIALGVALLTAIRPVWTIDPDAGLYVGLGRSLATGNGYVLDGTPHTKYPPGLPLLLSGLIGLGGAEAYGLFHAALAVALLAAVVLAHQVARQLGCSPGVALAVAAATGLSQTLFDLSIRYVRTEPLFLALSLGALLALWRSQRSGAGWGSAVLAAALVMAATLTRLAGVTLLVVPALALLRRGADARLRARAALVLLAGAAVVLAWQQRAAAVAREHPGAPDYSAEFFAAEPRDLTKTVRLDMPPLDGPALARRVAGNLDVMARAMAVLLTNVDRAGARLPLGVLALALVLTGLAVLSLRRGASPERRQACAYVAATLVLYLLWPFNQQERFYVPLLPLLLIAAGAGALALLDVARSAWTRPAARALLLSGAVLLLLVLALQRSDHPDVLGLWSFGYAGLLVVGAGLWLLALRLPRLPEARPSAAIACAVLLAVPFLQVRLHAWPGTVAAFELRRAAHPQPGALARVDVDPRLEEVAVFLRDHTPPDTVLMTDVPSILAPLSGRRCIPFVYRVQPPEVATDGADLVFYTRELPDAAAVMDACAPRLEPVLQLQPLDLGGRVVTPTVYRVPR